MIAWKFKGWRAVGVAGALSMTAACSDGAAPAGDSGDTHAGDEASAPATSEDTATAPVGEGGEAGEAGAASAYAGVSGEQLMALRLQHLRGFVLIAERIAGQNMTAEAGVLVHQGLLEVYDAAPTEFGSLNVELVRAAADGSAAHLRAAKAEIDRASGALTGVDHAALAARMVDISTGLYQAVNQADYVDPIEYQHSLGAALAAKDALSSGAAELRGENASAFNAAQSEVNRFVALWAQPVAPERPATYAQVLAQGSRVRLALSPYL